MAENVISNLRKLQLAELKLLKRFDGICKKEGLRYYIIGGTLLGAIRHKGFIPWDDDVDVAMPRTDYNKFLQFAEKYCDKEISIKHIGNDIEYRYSFARMMTSEMKIINHSANIPRVEEAWIDIIPLDGLPDNKMIRFIHKLHMLIWRSFNQIAQYDELVDQKRKRNKIEKMIVTIAGWKIFRKLFDYRTCLRQLDKVLQKYEYEQSEYVINYVAAIGFREIFEREKIGNGKKYLFEEIYFNGPDDYDYVCRTIYGDYMQLPPEDERNKHNSEIISE